jgi:hypothetical protein
MKELPPRLLLCLQPSVSIVMMFGKPSFLHGRPLFFLSQDNLAITYPTWGLIAARNCPKHIDHHAAACMPLLGNCVQLVFRSGLTASATVGILASERFRPGSCLSREHHQQTMFPCHVRCVSSRRMLLRSRSNASNTEWYVPVGPV